MSCNYLFIIANAEAQLLVESYPSVLFNNKAEVISVIEGTSLWLYCKVKSAKNRADIKWTMNGEELVKDLPHVYTTSSLFKSHTIAIIVVDGINLDDEGVYLCSVKYGERIYKGTKLTIRGTKDYFPNQNSE